MPYVISALFSVFTTTKKLQSFFFFTKFVQNVTAELRNVIRSVTNMLRGESFLRNIRPLVRRQYVA